MENKAPVPFLEIYLIRHAQSNGNAGIKVREEPTIKDMADPLLTQTGITQAGLLGEHLGNIQFDYVYSSALRRAVRTATEVIKRQEKPQKLRILPLLTENGMSDDYKIDSLDEIRTINPTAELSPHINEASPLLCYSDNKNEPELFARAKETVGYLKKYHGNGEKICVVSHAAFITYIVFHLMEFNKTPVFDIDFTNTGVTKIQFYKPGENKYGDTIFSYINGTSHLPENLNTK